MRRIERTGQFRRDYRNSGRGRYGRNLESLLKPILVVLASDVALPARHVDHPLIGDWRGYRDCHVKPDLVLIYRKLGDDVIELVRLGSHSELRL